MRVATQHLHRLVSADAGDLHGMQAFVKESRDAGMPKVVPAQVRESAFFVLDDALPDTNYGIGRATENSAV